MAMRCSSNETCSTHDRSDLSKEPMFCFETAMNMLYWSALVYDYEEVSHQTSVLSLTKCNPLQFLDRRQHAALVGAGVWLPSG
jgi:hypothetical protein